VVHDCSSSSSSVERSTNPSSFKERALALGLSKPDSKSCGRLRQSGNRG
jgi:hypothetical protein